MLAPSIAIACEYCTPPPVNLPDPVEITVPELFSTTTSLPCVQIHTSLASSIASPVGSLMPSSEFADDMYAPVVWLMTTFSAEVRYPLIAQMPGDATGIRPRIKLRIVVAHFLGFARA